MGVFLNKGNDGFKSIRNTSFVDKSMLIEHVNNVLFTDNRFMCVTRARRFGKSVAIKMLNAYYDQSCDSSSLFEGLQICSSPSFLSNLNRFPVIYLDMTDFLTKYRNDIHIISKMQADICNDLQSIYAQVTKFESDDLMDFLIRIVEHTGKPFICLIDEWDALCREGKGEQMDGYVDLLKRLFKGSHSESVFAGVYLTGILPIKRYNTQSALNNFEEYTMLSPANLASYYGFTEQEVLSLCEEYNADPISVKQWYDGYQIGEEQSMYNPYAVMKALKRGRLENYWTSTNTFEALRQYLTMNFEGLKDVVVALFAGASVAVNTLRFSNDMHSIECKDDVLTLLCHLGYLSFHWESRNARIPNFEVRQEFEDAIKETGWSSVVSALRLSDELLECVLDGEEAAVAEAVDCVHQDNTSILQYNDENSLACVLTLAFYTARSKYQMLRELPVGKGFADIVLLPFKNVDSPAIVLELKYDKSADTAISQIKRQQYVKSLQSYVGDVVLVGINYDRKSKKHSCKIERVSLLNPPSTHHQPTINPNVAKLLSVMDNGLYSTADLMLLMNLKDRFSFRRNYLNPALESGVVCMLYPKNPRQKGQKYYICQPI